VSGCNIKAVSIHDLESSYGNNVIGNACSKVDADDQIGYGGGNGGTNQLSLVTLLTSPAKQPTKTCPPRVLSPIESGLGRFALNVRAYLFC
jgi:hypothetical protein